MQEEQKARSKDNLDMEIVSLDDTPIWNERLVFPQARNAHFLRKKRPVQAILTTSVVLIVLFLLVGSNVAIRSKLIATVLPSTLTKTQAIPAGTDRFYVDGEPQWGHLFVDGKSIAHIPNPYTGEAPVHLQRGVHTLRWIAAPFLPQTCIVSVPPNFATDTCGYQQMLSNNQSNNQGGGWLFTFSASLARLSNTQQKALTTVVQGAMQGYTATDIVQPGEAYATDALGLQQATAHEPLRVTVRYTFDTDVRRDISCGPNLLIDGTSGCTSQGVDCRTFCNVSQGFVFKGAKTPVWNVLAATRATFTYTTLGGNPVTQTSERVDSTAQYEHLLPLQISSNGMQWYVVSSPSLLPSISAELPTPICDTAERKSESNTFRYTTFESSTAGMEWKFLAMPDTASCLVVVAMPQALASEEAQPYALCLYRFGIFLAANPLAHKYWPQMQLATQNEQRIAKQVYLDTPVYTQ